MTATYTSDEMMIVCAVARARRSAAACFVGIGLPTTAANLARRLHAPDCVLVYESGCIGSKPTRLPLSIGDGELAETADAVVSVPEIFAYWLQAGRIDVGFLGAAQLDRFGNINSTVIGDYATPVDAAAGRRRRPRDRGVGRPGDRDRAPIGAHVRRALRLPHVVGFGDGPGSREEFGLRGNGPDLVITDLGILRPDPDTCELVLTSLHPGVTTEQAVAATGWPLRVADDVSVTHEPSELELSTLRALVAA